MWPHILFWSIKMERLYMQSINQWTCIHLSDVNFPETTSVSLCRFTMVQLYLLLCLPMCVATAFLFQSPLRRAPFMFALGQTPVAATVVSALASLRVGFSLSIQISIRFSSSKYYAKCCAKVTIQSPHRFEVLHIPINLGLCIFGNRFQFKSYYYLNNKGSTASSLL